MAEGMNGIVNLWGGERKVVLPGGLPMEYMLEVKGGYNKREIIVQGGSKHRLYCTLYQYPAGKVIYSRGMTGKSMKWATDEGSLFVSTPGVPGENHGEGIR